MTAPAPAQNYYPDAPTTLPPGTHSAPFFPVAANPSLTIIESYLQDIDETLTLAVPAPAGTPAPDPTPALRNPSDAQLAAAVAAAVAAELDGTPFGGGVTLETLVNEAVKYREKAAVKIITEVVGAVIAANAGGVALETAVEAAILPDSKKAAPIVAAAIKVIAKVGGTAEEVSDELVAAGVADAAIYADKIIKGALSAAKKLSDANRKAVMQEMAEAAIKTAIESGVGYLIEEIAESAQKGSASGKDGLPTEGELLTGLFEGLTGLNQTASNAERLLAGSLRGKGSGADIGQQVAAAQTAAPYADADRLSYVGAGYGAAATAGSDKNQAITNIENFIEAANANYIDAIVRGAAAYIKAAAADFVRVGITEAADHGSTVSNTDIIKAVIEAQPKQISRIVNVAANDTVATTEQIATAVGLGADEATVGLAVNKLIKARGGKNISEPNLTAAVTSSIDALEASGRADAVADIAVQATKASKDGASVINAGLAAADPSLWSRIVVGAIVGAGKKDGAVVALTLASNATLATNPTQRDAAIAGADAALAVLNNKKDFFNLTLDGLTGADTPEKALAIVLGAGLANPKGIQAIAAAAVANTTFNAEDIAAVAKKANRKVNLGIDLAVQSAAYAKNPANIPLLFEHVSNLAFQNPKNVADITTGAVIAAPAKTHFIAHAAAFAAPLSASKFVPTLFAYSRLDSDQIDNAVDAVSAITAAVTTGILEAGLVEKKTTSALKAAVTKAVQSVKLLEGGTMNQYGSSGPVAQTGPAGVITGVLTQGVKADDEELSPLMAAVVTAAVKAAKNHALQIAQAAAHAIGNVTTVGASFNTAGLVAAIMAGKPKGVNDAEVVAAIALAMANLGDENYGAGVIGVRNYTLKSGTGTPVTSIFDL